MKCNGAIHITARQQIHIVMLNDLINRKHNKYTLSFAAQSKPLLLSMHLKYKVSIIFDKTNIYQVCKLQDDG